MTDGIFRINFRAANASARALACQPQFIVCDEPTSSLDVSVQAQVLNLMRDLQAEFGPTYLLVSHNPALIRHMCDDVDVMQRGRLLGRGPAKQVLDAPRHIHTQALTAAAAPDLHAERLPELTQPDTRIPCASFDGRALQRHGRRRQRRQKSAGKHLLLLSEIAQNVNSIKNTVPEEIVVLTSARADSFGASGKEATSHRRPLGS